MLIFFQNKFTSFDSKKNVPRSVQSDDGMNWLQQAEQYRVVLSTKIEAAQINSRSKERFRREAKLILQKNNPLEQLYDLEQSLQKYEEFVYDAKDMGRRKELTGGGLVRSVGVICSSVVYFLPLRDV